MSTKHYPYLDENKQPLYSKVRVENDGTKTFYFERHKGSETINNITGCRRVLYRLPHLLHGISKRVPIFLVEGEKDVDTLLRNRTFATTTITSLEWQEDYTSMLKDADVVILFDYDKTGFARRDMLSNELYGRVKRLRVVDLPGLQYQEKHGQDITDWLGMGNTVEQLMAIVNATPDYIPEGKLKVISLEQFLVLNIPPRKMLLDPILTEQGLVMLYAKRGVGKTHVALGIAYAIASGSSFLKWRAPEPRKVLYIDGEMPAESMQQRLRKISYGAALQPLPGYFLFITPDQQQDAIPDLSTKEGREVIDVYIRNVDLVVVDNISSLFRSGAENEAESWQPIQDWALQLRRRGKSVLFVHHAGKGGQQRGTSKKEDILDVVISLKNPDGYEAEQGACFEVHFEKTRHFAGEQAATFRVQLVESEDGSWQWQISSADHSPEILEVASMREEGKTMLEIMTKTGLSKSQVETRIKKAKQLSLLE